MEEGFLINNDIKEFLKQDSIKDTFNVFKRRKIYNTLKYKCDIIPEITEEALQVIFNYLSVCCDKDGSIFSLDALKKLRVYQYKIAIFKDYSYSPYTSHEQIEKLFDICIDCRFKDLAWRYLQVYPFNFEEAKLIGNAKNDAIAYNLYNYFLNIEDRKLAEKEKIYYAKEIGNRSNALYGYYATSALLNSCDVSHNLRNFLAIINTKEITNIEYVYRFIDKDKFALAGILSTSANQTAGYWAYKYYCTMPKEYVTEYLADDNWLYYFINCQIDAKYIYEALTDDDLIQKDMALKTAAIVSSCGLPEQAEKIINYVKITGDVLGIDIIKEEENPDLMEATSSILIRYHDENGVKLAHLLKDTYPLEENDYLLKDISSGVIEEPFITMSLNNVREKEVSRIRNK